VKQKNGRKKAEKNQEEMEGLKKEERDDLETKEKMFELEAKLRDKNQDYEVLEGTVKKIQEERDDLRKRLNEAMSELETKGRHQDQIRDLNDQNDLLKEQANRYKSENERLMRDQTTSLKDGELSQIRKDYEGVSHQLHSEKKAMATALDKQLKLKERNSDLEQKLTSAQTLLDGKKKENDTLEDELRIQQGEVKQQKQQIFSLQQEIKQLEKERDKEEILLGGKSLGDEIGLGNGVVELGDGLRKSGGDRSEVEALELELDFMGAAFHDMGVKLQLIKVPHSSTGEEVVPIKETESQDASSNQSSSRRVSSSFLNRLRQKRDIYG